jgi:hypothetical protein
MTEFSVGEECQVLVRGTKSGLVGSTGDVTITAVTSYGLEARRSTWFGSLAFFIDQEVIAGKEPRNGVRAHMALCEVCQ